MIIILLVIVFIIIAIIQIPSLIRKNYWRELIVFSCFLALAFLFSFLLVIGVKVPSPLEVIQYQIQDKFGLHY